MEGHFGHICCHIQWIRRQPSFILCTEMQSLSKLTAVQWDLCITYTIGTTETLLYMEVCLIQKLSNTVKYYCGMGTSVLNREMTFIHSVLYRELGSTVY